MAKAWAKFRGWPKWAQVTTGLILAFVVIGTFAPDDPEEVATTKPTTTAELPSTTMRSTTTEAPFSLEETRYLAAVRSESPEPDQGTDASLIAIGEEVCDEVEKGLSPELTTGILAAELSRRRGQSFTRGQETAEVFSRAALTHLCPQLTTTTTTTTTEPPQPVEVARYSGSADTETDDFTVDGKWQLSWTVSGGAGVSVTVRTPDGRQMDSVSIDPGESSSQFRQGCTCYLDISTFGSTYELVVTDVP